MTGFEFVRSFLCVSITDSTEKTTVQVFPPEYMGVVAKPPPPYIPADISVIGFLQRVIIVFDQNIQPPKMEFPMSNPVIERIHQHGSVRHYKPDPVSTDLIKTIVAAGQCASTSSNLQMYSVVVTTQEAQRFQLMGLCGDQAHIGQAPVFLTWCADLSRLERVCEMQGYIAESGYTENLLLAAVDVSLVMQNATLAAESLGLGICCIGGIRNQSQAVIDLLGLPRLVFPMCGMTLGWPERAPRIRPRLPLEAVLHWEQYQPDDRPQLLAYDQAMLETGIYSGRQVSDGEQKSSQAYGWLEHSSRRVSKAYRTELRQRLMDAGFEMK